MQLVDVDGLSVTGSGIGVGSLIFIYFTSQYLPHKKYDFIIIAI